MKRWIMMKDKMMEMLMIKWQWDDSNDEMMMQRRIIMTAFVWVKLTTILNPRLSFILFSKELMNQRINECMHILVLLRTRHFQGTNMQMVAQATKHFSCVLCTLHDSMWAWCVLLVYHIPAKVIECDGDNTFLQKHKFYSGVHQSVPKPTWHYGKYESHT